MSPVFFFFFFFFFFVCVVVFKAKKLLRTLKKIFFVCGGNPCHYFTLHLHNWASDQIFCGTFIRITKQKKL